uniref:Uncharacterized protein n=1 Tax=Setaria viridis TaxID=4556 RepID=A0A4V6DDP9_SETVI|nr:hypothetical protein SEVIR_1G301150v2 [Setaria viridis]
MSGWTTKTTRKEQRCRSGRPTRVAAVAVQPSSLLGNGVTSTLSWTTGRWEYLRAR